MADNRERFGPRRLSEDLENDRNKMLEKEKLLTKTIKRRTNVKKVILAYCEHLEPPEEQYNEQLDIGEVKQEEFNEEEILMDREENRKVNREEINDKFSTFVINKTKEDLDVFLADFITDYRVNKEKKKNLPPVWEPSAMGYLMNLIRKTSIMIYFANKSVSRHNKTYVLMIKVLNFIRIINVLLHRIVDCI